FKGIGDFFLEIVRAQEARGGMEDFALRRKEEGLHVLVPNAATAWAWAVGWCMRTRRTRGGISLDVDHGASEVLVQFLTNGFRGERHGSHAMPGASHEAVDVPEDPEEQDGAFLHVAGAPGLFQGLVEVALPCYPMQFRRCRPVLLGLFRTG